MRGRWHAGRRCSVSSVDASSSGRLHCSSTAAALRSLPRKHLRLQPLLLLLATMATAASAALPMVAAAELTPPGAAKLRTLQFGYHRRLLIAAVSNFASSDAAGQTESTLDQFSLGGSSAASTFSGDEMSREMAPPAFPQTTLLTKKTPNGTGGGAGGGDLRHEAATVSGIVSGAASGGAGYGSGVGTAADVAAVAAASILLGKLFRATFDTVGSTRAVGGTAATDGRSGQADAVTYDTGGGAESRSGGSSGGFGYATPQPQEAASDGVDGYSVMLRQQSPSLVTQAQLQMQQSAAAFPIRVVLPASVVPDATNKLTYVLPALGIDGGSVVYYIPVQPASGSVSQQQVPKSDVAPAISVPNVLISTNTPVNVVNPILMSSGGGGNGNGESGSRPINDPGGKEMLSALAVLMRRPKVVIVPIILG